MNLFKSSDVVSAEKPKTNPVVSGAFFDFEFQLGKNVGEIFPLCQNLKDGNSIYFMTDGAWSNIDIIECLLSITGPVDISFCTWSISTDAIRKFTEWQTAGLIKSLHVIMDQGIRNRKPEIHQQALVAFKNLRLIKCHAKVAVICNANYNFVIIGSANLTNNPRKEAGLIIRSQEIATANLQWMRKEFANA